MARFAGYGPTPIQPGAIMIGAPITGAPTTGSFTIFETGNADLILSQPLISGQNAGSFSLAASFPLTNDPNRPEVVYNLLCEVTAAAQPLQVTIQGQGLLPVFWPGGMGSTSPQPSVAPARLTILEYTIHLPLVRSP